MALIDHHKCVVLLCQTANLIHRSHIAIHREYTIGYDDAETLSLSELQALLQLLHIGVGIAITHCLAQAHTVDNRGVVERIGDDSILLGEQRLKDTTICVEAGGVEDCILCSKVVGDSLLQLLVHILTAADKTHR